MAMPDSDFNPFTPGTARPPLILAGRGDERQIIEEALGLITQPLKDGMLEIAPQSPIKIIGPRGVGKTTLLKDAKVKAQQQGIRVVDNETLTSLDPEGDIISGLLRIDDWPEKIWSWLSGFSNISSIGPKGVSFEERQKHGEKTLTQALEGRLKRQPVLLLLDEAMHYDKASFGKLLQKCQSLIGDKQPLAVIMAGTPSLDDRLGQLDATFLDRSLGIYINQVSAEAALEILGGTFEEQGIKVSDDALAFLAKLTDNYPYFIQYAGQVVWEDMKNSERRDVDLSLVEQLQEEVWRKREGYYKHVYHRISQSKLLDYANQVVRMVETAGADPLLPEQVIKSLASLDSSADAHAIYSQLLDLGLVWEGDDRSVRSAIPSFFSYFKEAYERGLSEGPGADKPTSSENYL